MQDQQLGTNDDCDSVEPKEILLDTLVRLCTLDIDAVLAYQQAAEIMQDPEFKIALTRFRTDHERHVLNLTNVIHGLDGEVPEANNTSFRTPELGSLTGVDTDLGILKAMSTNEVLINKTYDMVTELTSQDEALRLMLESHRDDEHRHLEYINDVIYRLEHGGKVSTQALEQHVIPQQH